MIIYYCNVNKVSHFKEGAMPIVIAPENKELTVIKIMSDEKTKKRLESMGITINGKIMVISSGGNVVCKVKEARVALDRDVATKIFVV